MRANTGETWELRRFSQTACRATARSVENIDLGKEISFPTAIKYVPMTL